MGKTKQAEKKFDRNVEISAPILDPEIIRAIHSPPKDQRIDVRHGGFRALLSDLNPQDSTDELTPITENHLPSYIGISCAVSGYSNYSSYGKKLASDNSTTPKLDFATSNRVTAHKLISTTSSKPHRSQTNSPVAVRADQPNVHHVTIDKSNINSIEDERKELTEKLTASATERHRSPSPIPPTEDDRHHGAYVGARYFPMPEPSKAVQKHIPLLGIDDDINSDEIVQEDVNKVEHKIASLYGDEFVEDWKESMSHRARKEHQDGAQTQAASEQPTKNLKDLVALKPTPPKRQEEASPTIDVPTPNIKVLAGVEKQFLNRLLTDENPPMPKSPSPSPQPPASPVSPRFIAPEQLDDRRAQAPPPVEPQKNLIHESPIVSPEPLPRSPTPPAQQEPMRVEAQDELNRFESDDPSRSTTPPRLEKEEEVASEQILITETQATPEGVEHETPLAMFDDKPQEPHSEVIAAHDELAHGSMSEPEHLIETFSAHPAEDDHVGDLISPDVLNQVSEEPESLLVETDKKGQENLLEISDDLHSEREQQRSDSLLQPEDHEEQSQSPSNESLGRSESPSSQISSSTVERAPVAPIEDEIDKHEEVTRECDVDFTSAPTLEIEEEALIAEIPVENQDDSSLVRAKEIITQEADDLVSFSPEPLAETNNNVEPVAQVKQEEVIESGEKEAMLEKYSPELTSIQETAEGGAIEPAGELTGDSANVSNSANDESGKIDGHYFLDLLKAEERFIMEQVRKAEQNLAERESEMDEDQLGRIHSAIGKANLLINKKCNQFKGLCEQSLNGNANEQYAVLNDDLAGFWDMISIQIADVRKSFENL